MLKILLALGASCALTLAAAADLEAGKAKADAACAVCHGVQGVATLPNAPNLAGQPQIYLTEQLKNYRSGKRTHEVMSVIAKPLSDQEIDDLSAWYASLAMVLRDSK
ncbi:MULTISPECIES: cytochrome c [unclassified Polaromonas]|uniref:c-type cytochrome n=1 Tax=unclassified Polaromonas TaxID=2638319 RepID=UPI001A2EA4C5|nr:MULTISPECIES: cytochrome c [unclassified Polaromonas]MBG6070696.1 cytochrome c553 [Polaromonas sp. CG_9.7]MBG6112996.1 cytochrome c553 [Polaromonas sp. CG_9.2]MDH6186469.1 cytochrome c553 [Polaromonas sp. CG_23.6]